jgi:hypothetical protein
MNLINKYNKKLRYNSTIRNIVNNVISLYCVYKGLSTKITNKHRLRGLGDWRPRIINRAPQPHR